MSLIFKHHISALAVLAGSTLLAMAAAAGDTPQAPVTVTAPSTPERALDAFP